MLDLVRNLVSSIFGKILLGIMVLSFALWGVGDILSSGNSQLAAKVGSETISLDEFYSEFQSTVRNYNQATQSNITMKEAYEMQLHNILLNDLIYSKMIMDYAKRKNIYINNESLKIVITDLPQFKNENGNFSELKYKSYILNNFPNEETFLKKMESIIYQGIIFENINVDNFISKSIIDQLYLFEAEKRSISYFLFNKDKVSIELNDQLLRKFYELNKEKYLKEKETIIDYIEINLEDFKKIENISTEQAKNYYTSNISQYSVKERREIEFARFDNETEALDFKKMYIDEESNEFKEFISNKNIKMSELKNFTGETFPDNITNEIFNLNLNEISRPLKYDDVGIYVFKIKKIDEAKKTKFEDVEDEIKDYLALDIAFQDFDESLNIADEMLINDYSFKEIANIQQNTRRYESINLKDFLVKFDDNLTTINDDMPIGYISDLIINENIAYIYTIINKEKSYIPEFHEIRNSVEIDFTQNEINSKLMSMAENIHSKLSSNDQESFENYASENKYEIINYDNLKRSNDIFHTDTIEELFSSKLNSVIKIKLKNGNIGLGRISVITKPKIEENSEMYKIVKNNIYNNFNTSLESLIGNEIIKNSTYEIYNQNIDRLFM